MLYCTILSPNSPVHLCGGLAEVSAIRVPPTGHLELKNHHSPRVWNQSEGSSVSVAEKRGASESPELGIFLHGALEVYHEDNVSVRSCRVLVARALERPLSAEHFSLNLDL